MNDKNLELIPDKDGFLFEIEDKGYIVFKLFITLFMLILLLFLYIVNGFSLLNIADNGRLGRLVVYISLPYFIYQLFFIIIYSIKKEKKKIKFYEKYILIDNSNYKIVLNEIKKIYILERNNVSGKTINRNKFIVIVLFPLFLYSFICSFLSLYILTKKTKICNLLFIMNNGDKISSISYGLLDKKFQQRISLYLKKYIDINFMDLERKTFLIPDK
ncbi:hypothetical protein O8C79_11040 [Aliarcobacter butzleri]|uniref:hypothetical protein n=1 Tax=Aliarcobacter butzleri TaxID=28197 RepID=UPI001919FAE4|nr:hypothetical protein [Aliarcobacter butzleri]MDN5105836.1 hypothetical protein [Aliarcobacter butzleri]